MKVRKSAALKVSAPRMGGTGFSHGYRAPANRKPSRKSGGPTNWDVRIFGGNHLAATVNERS
jgi:hypothetical protein